MSEDVRKKYEQGIAFLTAYLNCTEIMQWQARVMIQCIHDADTPADDRFAALVTLVDLLGIGTPSDADGLLGVDLAQHEL